MKKVDTTERGSHEKKRFRVFVSNLHQHVSHSALLTHFRAYGTIDRLRVFFKDSNGKVNKGYCHVLTQDESVFKKILDDKNHYFQGRKLHCTALITGSKLDKQNKVGNNKRVVVRNLPSDVTDNDLYNFFVKFGEIEMAYIFKAHGIMKQSSTFTPTGSVQFEKASVANKLTKKHYWSFEVGEKKAVVVVFPYIDKYIEIKNTISGMNESELTQLQNEIREGWTEAGLTEPPEYIMKEELIFKVSNLSKSKSKDKNRCGWSEESEFSEFHSCRPISKLYSSKRSVDQQAQSQDDNYRYNSRGDQNERSSALEDTLIAPQTDREKSFEREIRYIQPGSRGLFQWIERIHQQNLCNEPFSNLTSLRRHYCATPQQQYLDLEREHGFYLKSPLTAQYQKRDNMSIGILGMYVNNKAQQENQGRQPRSLLNRSTLW